MRDTVNHFMRLSQLGYRRLVPIVPPNAPLSEKSTLHARLLKGEDARGKAPGIKGAYGWKSFDWLKSDLVELTKWHDMGAGVGIVTGRGLAAIDADTMHKDRARIIKQTAERIFGQCPPIRIGNYPKALYLVRTDPDYRYTRIEFGERDDKGRLKERVEILSEGRQFVAHGIHPKTMKPYEWVYGLPKLDDLPYIAPSKLDEFLDALRPLLPAASDLRREGASGEDVDQESLRGDPDMVEKAVRSIRNTSDRFPTRESYLAVGYAIKAAIADERRAFDLFAEWCERWAEGENDMDVVRADWERMKGPYRRGASWLYELAESETTGDGERFDRAEQWLETEEAPLFPELQPKPFKAEEKKSPAEAMASRITPTPYGFPDPASIPRRRFLYGRHYIRQFVSATVAPSGVGKTALGIVECLAMASGKPLLNVPVEQPCRVWLWNGEDPLEELQRRIAAAMQHYGLTREDVGDRLFVDTGRTMEIIMAAETRDGSVIWEPVAERVEAMLREMKIDAMNVDPFVSSHRVSENDNGAIDAVTKRWARIADRTGAAIELVHHVRKLNGGDVTVEDSRGAVALLATARSKRALARMTKTEAKPLGLADCYQRFFRVGDERNNLALPGGENAGWFELRSASLGNGDEGADAAERLMNGDSVGVVTVWAGGSGVSGSAVEGGQPAGAEAVALASLASGEWRKDPRAGDAWAGVAIAQAMRLDLDDDADKATAKRILGEWIRRGIVKCVTRKDAQRRPREFVEVVAQADNLSENSWVETDESAFD